MTTRKRTPREEKIAKAIGVKIAALRKARGWTAEHLAGLAGIHRAVLSRTENGGVLPTIPSLIDISRALDVPMTVLVNSVLPTAPSATDVWETLCQLSHCSLDDEDERKKVFNAIMALTIRV